MNHDYLLFTTKRHQREKRYCVISDKLAKITQSGISSRFFFWMPYDKRVDVGAIPPTACVFGDKMLSCWICQAMVWAHCPMSNAFATTRCTWHLLYDHKMEAHAIHSVCGKWRHFYVLRQCPTQCTAVTMLKRTFGRGHERIRVDVRVDFKEWRPVSNKMNHAGKPPWQCGPHKPQVLRNESDGRLCLQCEGQLDLL